MLSALAPTTGVFVLILFSVESVMADVVGLGVLVLTHLNTLARVNIPACPILPGSLGEEGNGLTALRALVGEPLAGCLSLLPHLATGDPDLEEVAAAAGLAIPLAPAAAATSSRSGSPVAR